jgi:hypothetical protein
MSRPSEETVAAFALLCGLALAVQAEEEKLCPDLREENWIILLRAAGHISKGTSLGRGASFAQDSPTRH